MPGTPWPSDSVPRRSALACCSQPSSGTWRSGQRIQPELGERRVNAIEKNGLDDVAEREVERYWSVKYGRLARSR